MSVAELVVGPESGFWSKTGTGGHNTDIPLRHPAPKLWNRFRVTYEWMNLSFVLQAGPSHNLTYRINRSMHNGTTNQMHGSLQPYSYAQVAVPSIGMLTVTMHRQHNTDWWNGVINGFYNVGGTSPEHMGGDYWDIRGRLAVVNGSFRFASMAGETGSYSLAVEYDWVA